MTVVRTPRKESDLRWVGAVPAHWDCRKLKHIATVTLSNVDKKSHDAEEPVHLCNYVDVYYNERITPELDFMEATATHDEIRKFSLRSGDVLITKDSEAWDDIAVPAYVPSDLDGVLCGYHLAQVRPHDGEIDGEYLFRAFLARGINDQFRVAATGITRYGLGKHWIDNGLFLVPPINEQRAIARYLSRETARVDALIEKKQRQIELLHEKRAALISHAVTKGLDPTAPLKDSGLDWLADVPTHWRHRKLGYVASMAGGCTPSKSNEDYWSGEIPWVSPKNMKTRVIKNAEDHVSEEAMRETSLRLIEPPVVLIVVRGMILAHTFPVAVTTVPVTINQDMKALRPDANCSADYLSYLLEGISSLVLSHVEESAHGTKCMRTDIWKDINVYLPGPGEQADICERLQSESRKVDRLVARIEVSIDRLREYRTAIVSAAVTGKIDVSQEVA